MPEEFVPPVVAVVVASSPGEWFEECLRSLGEQDYPNLDVLVVVDAGGDDVTDRVAVSLPGAFVRHRKAQDGLAAAANEALVGVERASFLLFCHDDVALAPEAVRRMVEESFRSNAAIVGPKLVAFDEPSRLLQIGLAVDRLGAPVQRVEQGELDQSQHDSAQEVFAVPGACLLARTDLFAALGGFDEEIEGFGEDLDLCWRAQLAGARVVVAPAARVRHRQATVSGERGRLDAAGLRRRHQLRSVLKNYRAVRRARAVSALMVIACLEAMLGLFLHGHRRTHGVMKAWRWNVKRRSSLSATRHAVKEIRQVSDRELTSRMIRSPRARRPGIVGGPAGGPAGVDGEGGDPRRGPSPAGLPAAGAPSPHGRAYGYLHGDLDRVSEWVGRLQRGELSSGPLVVALVTLAVVLVALRGLLAGSLPVLGDIARLPTGVGLLNEFFSGRADPGWARHLGASPPACALLGVLSLLLGNSSALALKVILLAAGSIGAVGSIRLLRGVASTRGRVVAGVVFLAVPFAWNAIARGNLAAAVAIGGFPFLFARIARAAGLLEPRHWSRPFLGADPVGANPPGGNLPGGNLVGADPVGTDPPLTADRDQGWDPRALTRECVSFGLVLVLVGAFSPTVVVLAGVAVLAIFVAELACGRRTRNVARAGAVTAGGIGVAIVITLPWSVSWMTGGSSWSALSGAAPARSLAPQPFALLAGHLGPLGAFWGSFGLLAAAAFALFVAKGRALRLATASSVLAIAVAALSWAGALGYLGTGWGDSLALAAPVATCIALLCGLGATSLERELRRHRVGWRHGLGILATACLALGLGSGIAVALSGRAGMPPTGYEQYVAEASVPAGSGSGWRTLWIGDPSALPGAATQIEGGLAVAVSLGALPTDLGVWPPADEHPVRDVVTAVVAAERGRTVRLGALLSRLGIRYVVVPSASTPVVTGEPRPAVLSPPPAQLVAGLQQQIDLTEQLPEAGVLTFANTDWKTSDGTGSIGPTSGPGPDSPARVVEMVVSLVALVALLLLVGRRGWSVGAHRVSGRTVTRVEPQSPPALGSVLAMATSPTAGSDERLDQPPAPARPALRGAE